METVKKHAYMAEIKKEQAERYIADCRNRKEELDRKMKEAGFLQCRLYMQEVEKRTCLFCYTETAENGKKETPCSEWGDKWKEARHVYEFKLHEGDDLTCLQSKGIIIGAKRELLDEYIRLHDYQPQIIHDLCYQNGFRKSSIFVTELPGGGLYLLQFVEFLGEENPALYENDTYQEWLRVTGECQIPLPGEEFWKQMRPVYEFKR
ncbi:L-rhamnose mutarotase [Qiania dongpingensis]|uniref:L-rhamnose mutarotase n=1 Tax=Qiania dongpingensis TaxID=2763669 RepID=A0A7G9G269_9FIRM|nr:L-rhamnose mutarotase [Qiania dongpingensis]QNM04901.1 L-rhamnose mutarotase [Qiania dongpingensis]